ncbi:MAG: DUF86 domain-containing protein [Candidatus Omnitrophica bacterium]|nr:DUF86 domain-containing protein [Candidatus Omnitrophota bacterium]
MVNSNIIKAKINHVQKSLQRLKLKQNIALDALKNDMDLQDIVLHNLQLCIQGCIDMASHIISDEGWIVPGTLTGLFDILKEHNVISGQLNERLKKMVGFRNIIVHEYEGIDIDLVYEILSKKTEDIELFLKQIADYCRL